MLYRKFGKYLVYLVYLLALIASVSIFCYLPSCYYFLVSYFVNYQEGERSQL